MSLLWFGLGAVTGGGACFFFGRLLGIRDAVQIYAEARAETVQARGAEMELSARQNGWNRQVVIRLWSETGARINRFYRDENAKADRSSFIRYIAPSPIGGRMN